LRLLASAIASGKAHVAATDGSNPKENPSAWGWRDHNLQSLPQGRRVGWIEGDHLYLQPDSAYAVAQSLAVEQGESLTTAKQTLWKRLRERGLLASMDVKRQRLTIRRTVDGKRREVLHLQASSLFDR
jgi:hypothetical protein